MPSLLSSFTQPVIIFKHLETYWKHELNPQKYFALVSDPDPRVRFHSMWILSKICRNWTGNDVPFGENLPGLISTLLKSLPNDEYALPAIFGMIERFLKLNFPDSLHEEFINLLSSKFELLSTSFFEQLSALMNSLSDHDHRFNQLREIAVSNFIRV
jgi:hypothetical protein